MLPMRIPLVILVLLGLTIQAASGDHGVGRCNWSELNLGIIEVGKGDPAATYYVHDRNYLLGQGVWTYQESNGVYVHGASGHDNLQHGGDALLPTGHPEICTDVGPYEPDTLIYG